MNIGITIKDLQDILATITVDQRPIEVVYDHFNNPDHTPPFIVYTVSETVTNKADDKVHSQYNEYIVDLICKKKNVELEEQLEEKLNENYLPYDKQETYIETEQIYQIRYFI